MLPPPTTEPHAGDPDWGADPHPHGGAAVAPPPPPPATMLVVSDLHLGIGRDPRTTRFRRTENFFAGHAFARWLAAEASRRNSAAPGAGLVLVLAGDVFDFPRIADTPVDDDRAGDDALKEWAGWLDEVGVTKSLADLRASIDRKERRFGLGTEDYKSVWKLRRIHRGHPEFFAALGRWVDDGGRVVFVKGNHDLELHWPLVQRALRQLIVPDAAASGAAEERVTFEAAGLRVANVWVEHGHQYEGESRVDGDATLSRRPHLLNLPLGLFVNRYLINPAERIEPFLDNVKPAKDMVWALFRRHPIHSFQLLWRSWRFLARAVVARRFRDSLGYVVFFASLLVPLLTIAAVVLVLNASWAWRIVDGLPSTWRMVMTTAGLAAPYLVAGLRDLLPRRRPSVGEDKFAQGAWAALSAAPRPQEPYREVFAVLGHTHEQDVQALPPPADGRAERATYVNVGTWAPLWPEDRRDLIGRVLNPFARFTWDGSEYRMELLEWRDERGAAGPASVLEPLDAR